MSTEKDSIHAELADIQSNMIISYKETISNIISGKTPDDEVAALVVAVTPSATQRTQFIYPRWNDHMERENAISKINDLLKEKEALGAVVIQHILVEDEDAHAHIPGLSFSAVSPGHKATIFLTYEIDMENNVDFDMYPVDFNDAVEGLTVFHRN